MEQLKTGGCSAHFMLKEMFIMIILYNVSGPVDYFFFGQGRCHTWFTIEGGATMVSADEPRKFL